MGKRKAPEETETERKKRCTETDGQSSLPSKSDDTGGLEKDGKNIENYMLTKRRQAGGMQRPKVFLTMENLGVDSKSSEQSASEKTESRPPQLFVRDLQYLLIFALRRGLNYDHPRWCHMLRPAKMSSAVLIVLNEVSISDFQQSNDCFPFLQRTFDEKLRVAVMNPSQYFSKFSFDMYAVPMSASQQKGFEKEHGSPSHRNGIQVVFPRPFNVLDSCKTDSCKTPPKESSDSREKEEEEAQSISKTQLLLSVAQMIEENYPVPGEQDPNTKYVDYVTSKEKYAQVNPDSPMFAVDCEMCLTSTHQHELTRVSIVNEQNEVIYDELVKPYNPIINYLTRYSGITERLLDPVTKRIEDVQKEISELLPDDAILCGQSLGNDLCALKMFHPYVIDTSLIYNLSGSRRMKCSLKRLAFCFLGRVIQESRGGHSSAEDAKATMDLVQLKLQKNMAFGDAVLGGNITPFLPSYPSAQNQSTDAESSHFDVNNKGCMPGSRNTKTQEQSQPDAVMMRSLFDILSDLGVSACQVGGNSLVSRYQEEPGLKCCQTDSDQEACKKAGELCRDHKFTWVEFSAFADFLATHEQTVQKEETEEKLSETDLKQKKKVLKSLDKHIKKLVEQLPEKCLITVVMTGRGSKQHHEHAAAFLHIT